MESRVKRLIVNTLLVFLGRAGSSLIGLLMLPFYTYWLSPADYGTSDLVFTYTSIFVSFISCCMTEAIFIYSKGAPEVDKKKYYSSGIAFLLFSFASYSVLTLIVDFIGSYFNIVNTFFQQSWFILAISIGSALQMYAQSFTQGIDKMKVFTLTGVFFTLAIALASFILLPTLGLRGYLWAYVIANYGSFVFTLVLSKSYKYISFHAFDFKNCKELLSYGIPLIPNGIMWWLVSGINRPIMETTLGVSAVGVFAVANKIPGVVSMLCGIFNTAWSITMLEEYGKKDFNEFFNKIVQLIFFVMVLAGAFLSIFSKEIVSIFTTEEFYEAWEYIPFLVFSVILQNLSGLVGGVFSAQKKSKYFLYSSIWGAVSSLLFTYLLISQLQMYGVCLAMIISFVILVAARLKYAWNEINNFNLMYYIIMSSLFIGLAVTVVSSLSLIYKSSIYVVTFLFMLYLNRTSIDTIYRMAKTKLKKCNYE